MISFAIRTVDYVSAAEKSGLRQDVLRYDGLRHDPQVAEPPLCAMKSVICRQHWSGVPQTISTASMHSGSMVSDLRLAASRQAGKVPIYYRSSGAIGGHPELNP